MRLNYSAFYNGVRPILFCSTVSYCNHDGSKMEISFGLYSPLFFEKQRLGQAV